MRKIREVLRLKFEHNLSERKISKSCNISRSTVKDYLTRFFVSGLAWPLPDTLDEPSLVPEKTEKKDEKKDIHFLVDKLTGTLFFGNSAIWSRQLRVFRPVGFFPFRIT